jgi:hypothetical protein
MPQGLPQRRERERKAHHFGYGLSGSAQPGFAKVFCCFFSRKKAFLAVSF